MKRPTAALLLQFVFAAGLCAQPQTPDPQTVIEDIRARFAPDARTALFEATAAVLSDGTVRLEGVSDMPEALAQLRAAFYAKGVPTDAALRVVPDREQLKDKIWGLIRTPDAPVFDRSDSPPADLVPAGTPVRRYDTKDGLTRIQLPDGTVVRTPDEFIRPLNDTGLIIWNRADKIVVTSPRVPFSENRASSGVSLVMLGTGTQLRILEKYADGWTAVLPDGTAGFVARSDASPLEGFQEHQENVRRASQPDFMKTVAATALKLRESGMTSDADRLVRTAFRSHDLIIQRDADMMQKAFPAVDPGRHFEQLRAGDLLFFRSADGRLESTISLGKGRFVALPGMSGPTADLNAGKKADRSALRRRFAGAARPDPGFLTDPCLTSTRSNPFYQTPPKVLVPCRKRADVPEIR